ncbi:organic cation transporter protein-like [Dermacentor andersoni]|uniref:organic cation transporter protein-like n=1 Tax=Dermacentor andersoni TaxID=34620 RepID=UPI0021552604|nr:organic cation transporter protein-like [Dermacentor andersoni]
MSEIDVTNVIGDYGKFQRNVYLFCLLRGIPNGLHLVIYSFFLPAVEYWCARPDSLAANVTSEQWKSLVLSSNWTFGAYSSSLHSGRCRMFDFELSGEGIPEFGNVTVRCDSWEYGRSYYRSSLVQEWDLVCDRAWTRSLVQTATMSGMLVGTLVSSLGDRLGRRPMVIAGYVTSLVGSVCVAVSPWFSLLLLFRGLLGLGLGLGQTASFCLLMEVIGPQKRTTTAVAFSVGFAIGIIMLPGFAWLLQDWRSLQGAISVPLLFFVVWSWYLPESPRWLIATGKMTAARKVILKACADNGQPVDDIDSVLGQLRKKILQQEQAAKKKAGCLDLVRSRRVFLYTCILVYASAASGMIFYGLQLSVTNLGGDPYLTFVLAAVAELPVVVICYAAIRWCRRRWTMLAVYGIAGACAISVAVLPPEWVVPRQMCAIGGKMLASASLTLVWIFAAEVFPTLYRTVGVSACLVGTRVGSSTAPFLLELRTYLTDSIPMATLAAISVLASSLMLLLPETLRVALPDTIRESKQLGNSRKADKDFSSKDTTIDSKLQLAGTEPTALDNDVKR